MVADSPPALPKNVIESAMNSNCCRHDQDAFAQLHRLEEGRLLRVFRDLRVQLVLIVGVPGLRDGKGGEGGNTLQICALTASVERILSKIKLTLAVALPPNIMHTFTCSSTARNSNAAPAGFAPGNCKNGFLAYAQTQ